jgi:hypothetical protein
MAYDMELLKRVDQRTCGHAGHAGHDGVRCEQIRRLGQVAVSDRARMTRYPETIWAIVGALCASRVNQGISDYLRKGELSKVNSAMPPIGFQRGRQFGALCLVNPWRLRGLKLGVGFRMAEQTGHDSEKQCWPERIGTPVRYFNLILSPRVRRRGTEAQQEQWRASLGESRQ